MYTLLMVLILASASPRRRALLERTGLAFRVVAADVDESRRPSEPAVALARRLAVAKAEAVATLHPEAVVLGADTVVVLDGCPLGKPRDAAEARVMLARLRGREHLVTTGVCVRPPSGEALAATLSTRVWMRDYANAEIEAYVASGDPLDKAGAYAIQHPTFRPVERLVGCYTNVVGLPLCLTTALLSLVGLPAARLSLPD